MNTLFYDTETTGLPLFSEPSEDPRQPHIVQLAASLVDTETREVVASMDVIVKPEGWDIPEEVSAIHGITTQYAFDVGIPEADALRQFFELYSRAVVRVAHNEQFDARIIRIALMRYPASGPDPDVWKAAKAECTQRLATPILKLPPTQKMIAARIRSPYKSANLREAYQYFTGQELQGAHNAMADVRGCRAVYFAIKDGAERKSA